MPDEKEGVNLQAGRILLRNASKTVALSVTFGTQDNFLNSLSYYFNFTLYF